MWWSSWTKIAKKKSPSFCVHSWDCTGRGARPQPDHTHESEDIIAYGVDGLITGTHPWNAVSNAANSDHGRVLCQQIQVQHAGRQGRGGRSRNQRSEMAARKHEKTTLKQCIYFMQSSRAATFQHRQSALVGTGGWKILQTLIRNT